MVLLPTVGVQEALDLAGSRCHRRNPGRICGEPGAAPSTGPYLLLYLLPGMGTASIALQFWLLVGNCKSIAIG